MAPRVVLRNEQRRLLRITGPMPLISVSNLALILRTGERGIWRMLGRLRRSGGVWSARWGMTERRQEPWFPTRRALDLLYTHDHRHPSSRETARAALPQGYGAPPPEDFAQRLAQDHEFCQAAPRCAPSECHGEWFSPSARVACAPNTGQLRTRGQDQDGGKCGCERYQADEWLPAQKWTTFRKVGFARPKVGRGADRRRQQFFGTAHGE